MDVVEAGQVIRDTDGTWLMLTEQVAERASTPERTIEPSTIRQYKAAAARARRAGKTPSFPAPDGYRRVRRWKADGNPVVVVSPVWRQDKIDYWLRHRLGPGGRPVSTLRKRARAERAVAL